MVQSVKENKTKIADLQAIQLSKGQNSKGGEMPYYSKSSVEIFGKQPGPFKLKDTGSFWQGIDVKNIDFKGWQLYSKDSKENLVLGTVARRMFGNADKVEQAASYVFGLNNETRNGSATNESLATDILFPSIKKEVIKQSGLRL